MIINTKLDYPMHLVIKNSTSEYMLSCKNTYSTSKRVIWNLTYMELAVSAAVMKVKLHTFAGPDFNVAV